MREFPPYTRVRTTDPDTSAQAARIAADPENMTRIQHRVLEVLREAGDYGLTDLELEEKLGSHGSTFRTRRAELTEAGYIGDSGERRQLNGRFRIVWKLAPKTQPAFHQEETRDLFA